MAFSRMDSLATKVQKCLAEDVVEEKEMGVIRALLRSQPETKYGRNVLQRIGNDPLKLYDEMSRRGDISESNYSLLINILDKADLGEVSARIKEIIEEQRPERPHNLSMKNGSMKRQASDYGDAESKRRNYQSTPSSGSTGSFVSPDYLPSTNIPGLPTSGPKFYLSGMDKHYDLQQENQRGLVAIINNFTNKQAHGESYRKGTLEDEERIQQLFGSVNFRKYYKVMKPCRDLNASQFRDALRHWAMRLDEEEESFHSFFLFIMSHGDKGGVKTIDHRNSSSPPQGDSVIPIDEIISTFKKCIKGKPKVIVIQACRGDEDNVPEHVYSDSSPSSTQQPYELGEDEEDIEEVESDNSRPTIPPDASDMLTALATVGGYRSYRGKNNYSWFIKDFIDELTASHDQHKYYSTHITDLLTEVQNKVSSRVGKTISSDSVKGDRKIHVRQMPCFQSSLRKKFYLLPPYLPGDPPPRS